MKTFAVLLVMLGLLVAHSRPSALPRQRVSCRAQETEDDCLDRVMHPRLAKENPTQRSQQSGEDTNSFWLQMSKETIRQRMRTTFSMRNAKNIILFLGDGMGVTTIAAARNLLGGEEQKLAFEDFSATGLSKTYTIDKIVPDSASTATAYLCGVKNNYGTIGVNGEVERNDCEAMADEDNHVDSIAKWAMDAGKVAGFVTTTRVTHASPAGVYAHVANRDWESDKSLKNVCGSDSSLPDIALQLIHGEVGGKLKIMMGGGKREFIDSGIYSKGIRTDGRNLIDEFLSLSEKNVYVETKQELNEVDLKSGQRLLGLFQDSHMDYHLDAVADADNQQPTLEEMTRKALQFMKQDTEANANGYFLFIEGGRIDTGHHGNKARLALDETVEFSKAIAAAKELTDADDTLIVVTADHSHSFSVAGYQARSSDVFSIAPTIAEDDQTYMALSYANGPSFDTFYNTEKFKRRNPEKQISGSAHDTFPSTAPLSSETHSGEDVAVYANGPWSHLFTGVYDQHAIPHIMAYAACVGNGLKACS